MLQYMLDTNICIYVMKRYPAAMMDRFNALADRLCISAVTLGELQYGAEKSARRLESIAAIDAFVARLDTVAFSAKAAMHFGDIRAALERAGRPIGPFDLLIAAHARAEGLTLVTNNTREFDRVEGLKVENWV